MRFSQLSLNLFAKFPFNNFSLLPIVQQLLGKKDIYHSGVLCGMFFLHRRPRKGLAKRIVEAALEGQKVKEWEAPRELVQHIPEVEWKNLIKHVRAELLLIDEISFQLWDFSGGDWTVELDLINDLVEKREFVECAMYLICSLCPIDQDLFDLREAVDASALCRLEDKPLPFLPPYEHHPLVRSSLANDPCAWWAQVGVPISERLFQ